MNPRLFPRLLVLLLCLAPSAWTWAAPGTLRPRIVKLGIPPAPDGERFLFVLDVSSRMEDLQTPTEAAIFELIRTGVGGYMRAGDTYGVWSFNQETYTDKLAMQVWEPRRSLQLGTIAAASINNQVYAHSGNVKQLMQTLATVIQAVSNVTVFVLTDGGTDMTGTPFDKTINAEYRKQNRLRKQVKRPYVTTLVVRDGWFVDGIVRIAGQAIELPERPAPLPLAATNQLNAATSVLASATSATPAPPPAAPPRKTMQIATIRSNPPPAPAPAAPGDSTGVELGQSTAAQPTNAATATTSAPPPGAPSLPAAPSAAPLAASPTPAPAIASTGPPATPVARPPPAPAASPSSSPGSVAPASAGLLPDPVSDPAPRVSARERATDIPSPPTSASPPLPPPGAAVPSGVQALAPAPMPSSVMMGWMLAFGAALLVVASLLLLVVARRVRSHGTGSLITQSMDRR